MTTPIDLGAAIIARLRSEIDAKDLADVQGSLELADLLDRNILPQRFPAAFVLPIGEDADPDRVATGTVSQRVLEQVGILIVHKHAGSRTGEETRAALEPIKNIVRAALVGWEPAEGYGVLEEIRGRLVGLSGGAAFFQLDFRTDWHIRQPAVRA